MDKRTRTSVRHSTVKSKKISNADLIKIGKKNSKNVLSPSEYKFEEEKNCNIYVQEMIFIQQDISE